MKKEDAVDKWNKLAKKKLYINDTFEIAVGRLIYLIILNLFITVGMLFSGGTIASVLWLWVDLVAGLQKNTKTVKDEDFNALWYKQETGRRPYYNGKRTRGFDEWLTMLK